MNLQYMQMQILELGLLILSAYIGGLIARKIKIGEVVGQIFGGIIVGPHFLELIHRVLEHYQSAKSIVIFKPIYHFYETGLFREYSDILENYHFFVFLFLGMIAFSIGEELHRDRLKQVGIKATVICLIQGLLTFVLIALGFYFFFGFTLIDSLIIGSIGIATAPALTFILMNKLHIGGKLKNILANIVVLDDVIEVIFFSVFLGLAIAKQSGKHPSAIHLFAHVGMELIWASFIGFIIFLILKFSIRERSLEEDEEFTSDTFLSTVLSQHPAPSVEILLVMVGVVSLGIAVALHFNLPFLITAVVAGLLISNFHNNAIFDSLKIENVMPIFNLIFFAIIGASVRLESFNKTTLFMTLGYVVFRASGKLFGNWWGAKITNQDPKITATLPKLMLPQAGMAAVETILVATVLKNGSVIFDTIIPALVIFELGGAFLSEKTLIKWKNWTVGEKEAIKQKPSKADFSLSHLIQDRIINLMANNKTEVFFEMAQLMVKNHIIPETSYITNSLSEREKLASTGIGNGVAIPHCRVTGIKRPYIACGFLKKPIDWNAPDNIPVNTVFVILTPETNPEDHIKVLKTLAFFIHKKDFLSNLKNAFLHHKIKEFLKENDNTE